MSARSRMTMRATLERDLATADPYGHLGPPDWQALATVPCFAWAGSGKAKRTYHGNEVSVTVDSPGMVVPSGTDLIDADRVTAIKDRLGVVLFESMTIDAVLHRKDHLEVRLQSYA